MQKTFFGVFFKIIFYPILYVVGVILGHSFMSEELDRERSSLSSQDKKRVLRRDMLVFHAGVILISLLVGLLFGSILVAIPIILLFGGSLSLVFLFSTISANSAISIESVFLALIPFIASFLIVLAFIF